MSEIDDSDRRESKKKTINVDNYSQQYSKGMKNFHTGYREIR